MSDDPVRIVEPADRGAVLVCFDTTARLAFTVLSRLTAGDSARALDLLVDTYAYLDRTARRTGWSDVDPRWVVDAAHRVYAAMSTTPGADAGAEIGAVAALTVAERVALSLHLVERRTLDEVAAVLDGTADEAAAAVQSGSTRLIATEIVQGATAVDVIRRGEIWFDDSMRSHARRAVGNGWASADAPAAKNLSMLATSAPIVGAMRLPVTPFATKQPEHFAEAAEFTRTRRSRWTVVGAGLGIAAVLVALAVWVMPSSDGETDEAASLPSATNATSTSTKTTATDTTDSTNDTLVVDPATGKPTGGVTTDDPTAMSDPTEVAGFFLDPVPAGFLADGAGPAGLRGDPLNWFELWTTPDVARTAGRWFAVLTIDSSEASRPTPLTTTARRVDLGGNSALVDVTADGVMDLFAEFPGRQQIRFESFGLSADELVQLASATTFGPDNRPSYGPDTHDVVDGLDLRASRATTQSVLELQIVSGGGEGTRAQYQSADGSQFFTILTSPQVENDLVIASLITPDSRDVAAQFAPNRTIDIGGRTVHVGSLATPFKTAPADANFNYVEWHEGDSTVLLVGLVDLPTLLDAVPVARLATADEWHEVLVAPRPDIAQQPNGDDPGAQPTPQVILGENTTAAGDRLSVSLAGGATISLIVNEQRASDPAATSSGRYDQFEDSLAIDLDPEHPLITLDTIHATIAVVVFDEPPAATAVRYTIGANQPIDVLINPLIGTTLYGAAFSFSEYDDCKVSLIDDAGNVIRTLSS